MDGGEGWRCIQCWKLESFKGSECVNMTKEARRKFLDSISIKAGPDGFKAGEINSVVEMPFTDQLLLVVFFFLLFGSFIYVPVCVLLCLFINFYTGLYLLGFVVVLMLIPAPYWPSLNDTLITKLFIRYCSYRAIMEGKDSALDEPVVGLVPPHGVFPLQNLLVHFILPKVTGSFVRGLAADALLWTPIIRHFIAGMGGVSASKKSALKALGEGFTTGVSPDGIAGIFEVNDPDEVLITLRRRGIYDIAIRSGKPLIVSYTFGATKAFSAWFDKSGKLASISRLLRVSLFYFWGRWGLPVPRRTPITTVFATPIPVKQCDSPTEEQIEELRSQSLEDYRRIFDLHKKAYGWPDKQLVFK
jgi:2-acylglycerol O-acyltransferase 2